MTSAAIAETTVFTPRGGTLSPSWAILGAVCSSAVALWSCYSLAGQAGLAAGVGAIVLAFGLLAIPLAAMGQRAFGPTWLWWPVVMAWLGGLVVCAAGLWLPATEVSTAVLCTACGGLYFETLAFLTSCPDENVRSRCRPDVALAGLAVGVWLLLAGLISAGPLNSVTVLGALCFLSGFMTMPAAEPAPALSHCAVEHSREAREATVPVVAVAHPIAAA